MPIFSRASSSILAIAISFSMYPAQPALCVETGSTEGSDSGGVEEIIVTAQKRSENVQAVAATVSVINAATLEARGVSDLRGVTNFAPMLELSQENVVTQIFIRGIGQPSDAETNDPAVAANMDGVYTPRYTLSSAMFDVERVEVLSGPQGTLYGRNAAGGAVNIATRLPTSQFGSNGSFEAGNFGLVHAFAALNVPVTSDFKLRAAVDQNKHDGYVSNGQDALDTIAGRLTGLYTPLDALTVVVRGEYQHAGGPGDSIILAPYIDPAHPWYQPNVAGENFFVRRSVYKANAEVNYDIGGPQNLRITFIPAYIYYNFRYRTPIGVPVNYYPNPGVSGNPLAGFAGALENLGDLGRQLTNELRMSGRSDQWNWVLGLYQLHSSAEGPGVSFDIYNPGSFSGGPFLPYAFQSGGGQSYQNTTANSKAIFGQATYSLLDRLRLTAGARYSSDRKRAQGVAQTLIPIAHLALPAVRYDLGLPQSRVDWKVGLESDLSATSMLYATVQTGYIGGGFNVVAASSTAATFKPEELLAYTLGIKNTLFDNRLRLNAEAFYYDYKNLQVSAFSSSTGSSIQYNLPKSSIYGTQLELTFKLLQQTTIDADLGYLKARIDEGVLPPSAVYNCGVPGAIDPSLCSANNLINYSGYSLPNSPQFSASAGITQVWGLSDDSYLEGRVGTHYEDSTWALFSHIKGLQKPAYTKTDVSLTYHAAADRWSVGIWGKNLENAAHLVTPSTTNVYGLNTWFIEAPRTYGIRLAYNFY